MNHYSIVHEFIPLHKALRIPDAKSSCGKMMRQARDNSSLEAGQSQEQKGSHSGSTKKREQRPLCISDGLMSSQKLGIGIKIQKYTGRVVFRGYIVTDDSGACGVFTEQGSSASQMAAAKVMDLIARLPDCDGQTADAISVYTPEKLEDAPKLLRIPKSECPDIWIRIPRHKLPKSWSNIEVPLKRNL